MTPAAFIEKWSRSELRERQGSQSHFNDLCALIGEPNPTDDDPTGASYCFERGATKVGGGDGWADVWRRNCFGWEYKGKHKDLNAALRQLQIYAPDLENPPYLVVCDMERIVVHTNWTNTIRRTLTFGFDDLREATKREQLRQVFRGSDALKPGLSPQELTAKVAARFGDLGRRLQDRKHDPQAVAHFLNRLIFCMFAEDAEILPKGLFTRTVRATRLKPKHAKAQLDELFSKMRVGGFFGSEVVRWFNGGLFDDAEALPLEQADLELLADTAAEHDWSNIDPAVFGTMFEEALKTTGRRAALGAHYTDREKILKIVDPVIIRPLMAEWDVARLVIAEAMTEVAKAETDRRAVFERLGATLTGSDAEALPKGEAREARQGENLELFEDVGSERLPSKVEKAIRTVRPELTAIAKRRSAAFARAKETRDAFLTRLSGFRVLDPACGSGNFLYVALQALRDIELRALLDADRLGVPQAAPRVGLDALRGIEIEAYAAELARVTLWIGNLQWERRNGYTAYAEPILSTLDTIENRDALLNPDGSEAEWPEADVIIGNPPFLGGKKHNSKLNLNDLDAIRRVFANRVSDSANFVMYWFQKSLELVAVEKIARVGFIGTQAVRRGASNQVIRAFSDRIWISDAVSNEAWTVQGAAVRVSVIVFSKNRPIKSYLDGELVDFINVDLTADSAKNLPYMIKENKKIAFQGTISGGPFEIPGKLAREIILNPLNPNGCHNTQVVKPWRNADDLSGRSSDYWIIDFGDEISDHDASLFEIPYEILKSAWKVANAAKIIAKQNALRANEPRSLRFWWRLQRRRSPLLSSISQMSRFIATPRVAKYRYFLWLDPRVIPDTRLVLILKDDDTSIGILSSKVHEVWALRFGGSHGVGNDPEYIHTLTFNAFPFPEGLTPNISATNYANDPRAEAIAAAAMELNRLRENWLNPSDLVRIEPEVYPTAEMLAAGHPKLYPDRILPKDEAAAAILKTRTLTNLYNARPVWLDNAHKALDAAVAAAYGWPADLPDDEILARLFALNQERAAAGR